jgi:hypothetical protein
MVMPSALTSIVGQMVECIWASVGSAPDSSTANLPLFLLSEPLFKNRFIELQFAEQDWLILSVPFDEFGRMCIVVLAHHDHET